MRPAIALRVLSKKRKQVLESGKLKLAVTVTGAPSTDVEARVGTTTIGSATVATGAASLKLSKAGRRAIEKRNKVRLSLRATVDFGVPVTVVKKLK